MNGGAHEPRTINHTHPLTYDCLPMSKNTSIRSLHFVDINVSTRADRRTNGLTGSWPRRPTTTTVYVRIHTWSATCRRPSVSSSSATRAAFSADDNVLGSLSSALTRTVCATVRLLSIKSSCMQKEGASELATQRHPPTQTMNEQGTAVQKLPDVCDPCGRPVPSDVPTRACRRA